MNGKISNKVVIKIEKAIYGLAAEFDNVHFEIKEEGITEFSYFKPDNVCYAQNVAFTLSHDPQKTITTTQNQENGRLILVQKGFNLFFKFIPTTKDGERIYRYVKQRKLRQCSYIARILGQKDDVEAYQKIGVFMGEKSKMLIDFPLICEICLTNTPANKNTFCTTDVNDPRLKGIEWKTNIQHSTTDYWEMYCQKAKIGKQIAELDVKFRELEKKIDDTLSQKKEIE